MHWIALQPLPDPYRSAGGTMPDHEGPPALVDPITALGWWALNFTPKVARLEDTLVLEVSASERLWGGRQQLLCQMFESTKAITDVQYAQGATSLIATARLQTAGLVNAAPNDLPLAALAAARPHLATMQRIGCTRWGQLRALPRGGVVRRFGSPLLDALDQAYGLKPELYSWLILPDVFEATLELGFQVETAPAMLFVARRLFRQLQVWLQARQWGVLALELMWTMDARRDTATQGQLVLRTAEPTSDMAHLQRLLSEHLARITLPAPVLYLHLRTRETKKLDGETASLLPNEQKTGDGLHHLLERLSARLGSKNVLQIKARSDHRPEQMQILLPSSNAANFKSFYSDGKRLGTRSEVKEDVLYPTWLLLTPLKLAVRRNTPLYQGALTLLAGPQRLEAGWWGGGDCTLRDYFLARSEQAGLLWIYRERVSVQQGAEPGADVARDWYLHGLFA